MFFPIKILLFLLKCSIAFVLYFLLNGNLAWSESGIGEPGFNDTTLDEPIKKPDWFKLSFLDLNEDLEEAISSGKRGLVIYFGMDRCPYCKALIDVNFSKRDIVEYTQKHFDVIAIDVRGSRTVTDFSDEVISEKEFAIRNNANFTPTLIFYNQDGKEIHRLVGYYSPYRFQASLEYAADGHYKKESFREYLSRGEHVFGSEKGKLNYRAFSMGKPYLLSRNKIKAQRPLLVVFEQGDCHACNVLHASEFGSEGVRKYVNLLDVVQLDIWDEGKVLDPAGRYVSAKMWAEELGVFYTPTLLFFDESGKEVLRLSSIAHFNRLNNVFKYITSAAYKKYRNFADWRNNQ